LRFREKKPRITTSIFSREVNGHWQAVLINFQKYNESGFKWILTMVDVFRKYLWLWWCRQWEKFDWQGPIKFDCWLVWTIFSFLLSLFNFHKTLAKIKFCFLIGPISRQITARSLRMSISQLSTSMGYNTGIFKSLYTNYSRNS